MDIEEFASTLEFLSRFESFNAKLEELNKEIEGIWFRTGDDRVYRVGVIIKDMLVEFNKQ